jgi:C1A family cysteine protease
VLDRSVRTLSTDEDLAHMRHIKQAHGLPDTAVFVDDPRILDRELPAPKVDETTTSGHVICIEWCAV